MNTIEDLRRWIGFYGDYLDTLRDYLGNLHNTEFANNFMNQLYTIDPKFRDANITFIDLMRDGQELLKNF